MADFRPYFFDRVADGDNPAGITVSKSATLPDGYFGVTEYIWGGVTLWFVDGDEFTAEERNMSFHRWVGIG